MLFIKGLKLGAGNSEFNILTKGLGEIGKIYEADYDKYIDLGISERLAEKLDDKSLSDAKEIYAYCVKYGIQLLCFDEPEFPMSLKSLKNPPALLYCMGNLPDLNRNLCISVVGTRKMSEYGMNCAYKIAYEMAAAGAVVVSGMALGIDGVAACGAISGGGKTVAVLGSGIDVIYPKEHSTLYKVICHNGAVITEFAPSTAPSGVNFPIRNRIISGLSQGTLVVDADKDSGAMITAKNAILQGRDIYAVPGNIDGENTSGTNMLIRDGAQAVLSGKDIIKNYSYVYRETINLLALADAEKHSDIDMRAIRDMEISLRYVKRSSKTDKNENDKSQSYANKSDKNAKSEVRSDITAPDAFKKSHLDAGSEIKKTNKVKKEQGTKKPEAKTEDKGDMSPEILKTLSDKQRRIFDEIPLDKPVSVDSLTHLGFSMGEIMSSLTILEIKGLISSLPGALYIRK